MDKLKDHENHENLYTMKISTHTVLIHFLVFVYEQCITHFVESRLFALYMIMKV